MRIASLIVVIATLAAAPASAQIMRPVIAPPPCTGHSCMPTTRGVPLPPANLHSTACPPGTVYVPKKGTCKVLPTTGGTPG